MPGVVGARLDLKRAVDDWGANAALHVEDVGVLRQRNKKLHGSLVPCRRARVVDAEVISVGRFLQHRIEGFLAGHFIGRLPADCLNRLLQLRRLRRPTKPVSDRLLEPDDLAFPELAHLAILECESGKFFVLRRQPLHDCAAARFDEREQLRGEGVGKDLVLRDEYDIVASERLAVEEVVDHDVEVVVADAPERLASPVLLRVPGHGRACLAIQDVVPESGRVAQHGKVLDWPHPRDLLAETRVSGETVEVRDDLAKLSVEVLVG